MRILFLGDVMGRSGRTAIAERLGPLRASLRADFCVVNAENASGGMGLKINLPPSYLLIHRVWLGGLAVLSQLGVRAAFVEVLEEFLPGYADAEA